MPLKCSKLEHITHTQFCKGRSDIVREEFCDGAMQGEVD